MIKIPRKNERNLASFRDPSGFVFSSNGIIYRQINENYIENYNKLFSSGLYEKLISLKYLVSHEEVNLGKSTSKNITIKPEQISFISYPYEWCFSQLKDAALLTLKIQKVSLEHNMSLKDASAFNVQFLDGKPILIDTLSFEKYIEGKPWIAYKQFIEHFLAPLALMSMTDTRLNRLSSLFIEGIPLDLVSKILPFRSKFSPSLLIHIHAHASSQKKFSQKKLTSKQTSQSFSRRAFLGLLDSLESTTENLRLKEERTEWASYYDDNNNYESTSLNQKAKLVKDFLSLAKPKIVWDLGANTGFFSAVAAKEKALVISMDSDIGALEKNYRKVKEKQEKNILPLFVDLTNPTASLGFNNTERLSFSQRGPADTILALALIHHLAISKNIPLEFIASFMASATNFLIIEFVPKSDSQVEKLLMNRQDIFPNYTKQGFEKAFQTFFEFIKIAPISNSKRVLYLMKKR